MTGECELGGGEVSGLRRAVVLMLLDERAQLRSVAELHAALPGCEREDLEAALAELERAGVVDLVGTDVSASPATRLLDALNLIGI
jgi:DNA-binding HxlR family transcriptional regulator